ncbi:MAG: metallophosphoesterase [Candidatus Gastranaerophilales bacterium]|nr:metallophosphoesterase [Candidatus Gastranaerophilales bacterium]
MKKIRLIKKFFPSIILSVFFIVLLGGACKSFSDNAQVSQADKSVSFVHFTDVHIDNVEHQAKKSRMLKDSKKLLKDGISQVNEMEDVDLAVFSGDCANKSLTVLFSNFANIVNGLKIPWFATIGNHESAVNGEITKENFARLLSAVNKNVKTAKPYYAIVPKKGYLFLFLDSTYPEKNPFGYFDKNQLDWLNNKLFENADKKVIIIQHHPAIEPFKSKDHYIINVNEFLNILDKHSNVIAVISGHYHANKIINRNNVLHISTSALVEYPNSFRKLKVTDEASKIKIESKIIETRLKNIRSESQKNCKSAPLLLGKSEDRDFVMFLDKK